MARDTPTGGTGDGDGDDATTDSVDYGSLLSNSESIDGVGFPLASGINVTRVAQTIIASIVFAVSFGVTSIIDAVTGAYAGLVDGIGEFIADGLIGATLSAGVGAIRGAWTVTLDEFGLFGWVIALGIMLATFFVVEQGIETAREVL